MPLLVNDTFDLPYYAQPIQVALEPARSAIHSLTMLTRNHNHVSGVADWVPNTVESMHPDERNANQLVMNGLYYTVLPEETWNSFPAYIDHLEAMRPEALRDKMLQVYKRMHYNPNPVGEPIDLETALQSSENYIAYLKQRFVPESVDEVVEHQAYQYVMDPPALQRLVVGHLRHMWDKYLEEEWERVRPMLQEVVRAYRKVNLKGKSYQEATQIITGQPVDEAKWGDYFTSARHVIFAPHPHVGPYLPKCHNGTGDLVIFFGAHLPEGMEKDTPELTRTEIFIRLSALADDTRLRILRYIAENGEQRSQAVIDALDLSQSAASRQLTQLSTAGFLTERRCDGAKCYALNPERLSDTLQAIASFLLVNERSA